MYKRRRRIRSNAPSANTGQLMNLALFIMLLAFFIVLNAISAYESGKTEQARQSVEIAFSNVAKTKITLPAVTEDPTQAMREGHTFDRLDALFEAEIVSFDATKSKTQGVMKIRVPYKKFSKAILAVGQRDILQYPSREQIRGNFFLPTLVSLLRKHIDGAPTRLEIFIHTEENPARLSNVNPTKMADAIRRVGVFSQHLEVKGMPEKLINIGISEGDPDYVDLVFRKYVPYSPVTEEKKI